MGIPERRHLQPTPLQPGLAKQRLWAEKCSLSNLPFCLPSPAFVKHLHHAKHEEFKTSQACSYPQGAQILAWKTQGQKEGPQTV